MPKASRSSGVGKRAKGARVSVRSGAPRPADGRGESGLAGFAMHIDEPRGREMFGKLADSRPAYAGFAATAPVGLKALDPETAALHHLNHALASEAVKGFARPKIATAESEFKTLGSEAMPLTDTTVVKFRQTYHKIPVYGSLVSVELDKNNECLGINSSLGTPEGVGYIASVSPAKALAVAAEGAGQVMKALSQTPTLYYYYDQAASKWRLAYIVENVPQRRPVVRKDGRRDALLKDYVVDAQTGKLLTDLPRTPTMASGQDTAKDGLGANRTIGVEVLPRGTKELRDAALHVTTYGFGFRDPSAQENLLPGTLYKNPPNPWPVEAVAAHANGSEVSRFLRNVVKRNDIDNKGGEMISSVDCWDRREGITPAKQWKNAFWNGRQMVYGQVKYPDGSFFSLANMLDVVGHEMFHGVTDSSSRLEYRTQPGALNESYSDIFGTIIANYAKPLGQWNWRLGEGFDGPGTALRDMQDPARHGQPKNMRDFRPSSPPYTFERNDYGWVHDNSGIHNFAAYSVMTAMSGGKYLFSAAELAAMFYIALTVHLSRTSQFTDSRRAAVQAARSLFRNESAPVRDAKVKAVEDGYSVAGIV
jgi:Zn-dependent metalloprotease